MARPRYELWGESLRELGVLILVFVPLDVLVEFVRNGQKPDSYHWATITVFALVGIAIMAVGVEIERRYTMWLPLTTFGLIVAGMIGFGFYDKAKYLAAHPDEKTDGAEKKL